MLALLVEWKLEVSARSNSICFTEREKNCPYIYSLYYFNIDENFRSMDSHPFCRIQLYSHKSRETRLCHKTVLTSMKNLVGNQKMYFQPKSVNSDSVSVCCSD